MAKQRKLDRFTTLFVDRHGKERCRFRRKGFSCYLPHPSAKGYREAYAKALQGFAPRAESTQRTVGALLTLFYASIGFKRSGAAWQKNRRQVLETFREEFGSDLVSDFEPQHIDLILAAKMEKRRVGKRMTGGTAAADRLRDQLLLLFRFAVKLKWIASNPVEQAEEIQHKGKGFHEWNEEEVAQFRAFWPLGTKPRLAMELVLWTGARRANAHRMAPPRNGRIGDSAVKTGKAMDVQVAPLLAQAIEAMPVVGIETLLVTDYGKPFSVAGFGNWFADKCDQAGLPQCRLHGLRKALARRAADLEVSQQGLKALGQWSSDRDVATYVAGANRKRLAESALDAVIAWEREANIV
jgi:hypothetical protein